MNTQKNTPRSKSTITPPDPNRPIADYPQVHVGPGTNHEVAFRAHDLLLDNSLCDSRFFSSSTDIVADTTESTDTAEEAVGGRFDLPAPAGTCNTAADAFTALRERLGSRIQPDQDISADDLFETQVTELRVVRQLLLADFRKPGPKYIPGDIAGPISGNHGYRLTQQWAQHMHKLGFDGIIARSRHGDGDTMFFFGSEGVQEDFFKISSSRSAHDVYKDMAESDPSIPGIDELDWTDFDEGIHLTDE